MYTIGKAFWLHAKARDLKFLNPVRNRLAKVLGGSCRGFELGDPRSNAEALIAVGNAASGFVVVLAHGGSDYIRGGEYMSRLTGEIVEVEKFVTRQDLGVFSGKVVFCLSCDSNQLAQAVVGSGAIAFVGFDEVPFDRFDASGSPIGSHVLVKHCQALIAEAVQATLDRFIAGRASLEESVDYLRLWIAQKAVNYVRQMGRKGVKERKEVAALFLKVKSGVKVHGVRGVWFKQNG